MSTGNVLLGDNRLLDPKQQWRTACSKVLTQASRKRHIQRPTPHQSISNQYCNTMKQIFALFGVLSILPVGIAFAPYPSPRLTTLSTTTDRTKHVGPLTTHKNVLNEIAHELHDELGQPDPTPRHVSPAHAVQPHETKAHKLRRALVEKDQAYHALLDELHEQELHATSMEHLGDVLHQIRDALQHQNELLRHKKEISRQQQETLHMLAVQVTQLQSSLSLPVEDEETSRKSIRSLMWQIVRTVGRRVRKLAGRLLWWRA